MLSQRRLVALLVSFLTGITAVLVLSALYGDVLGSVVKRFALLPPVAILIYLTGWAGSSLVTAYGLNLKYRVQHGRVVWGGLGAAVYCLPLLGWNTLLPQESFSAALLAAAFGGCFLQYLLLSFGLMWKDLLKLVGLGALADAIGIDIGGNGGS